MRKPLTVAVSFLGGFLLAAMLLEKLPSAGAGGGQGAGVACAAQNGDVNADGTVNLTDAVAILGNLFLGNPTELPPLCATPPPSGLAATGQTACWRFDEGLFVETSCSEAECPGQDGLYRVGCPAEGRYVDNEDGTVTDTCTGLMWQKDTADVNNDEQISPAGDTVAMCDALSYCEGLVFAGHDDWRLPNIRELQSIVDYGRMEPSIDPAFGGLAQYYWSSTSYLQSPNDGWGIGFNVGYVGVRPKFGDFDFSFNFVRAVRGGTR